MQLNKLSEGYSVHAGKSAWRQPEAHEYEQFGEKHILLIKLLNAVFGSKVPEDQQGYNKVGRSTGILRHLTSANGWSKLRESSIGKVIWSNIPDNLRSKFIAEIVRRESKGPGRGLSSQDGGQTQEYRHQS